MSMPKFIFSSSNTNPNPNPKNERKKKKQSRDEYYFNLPFTQEHVLLNLPIKSLMRFNSVSKPWRSIIQSRVFIDMHRRRGSNNYSDQLVFLPYDTARKSFMTNYSLSTASDLITISPGPSDLLLPSELSVLIKPEQNPSAWRRVVRVMGPLNNSIYCLASNFESSNGFVSVSNGRIAFCNPATHNYKLAPPLPLDAFSNYPGLNPVRVHYGFGSVTKNSYGDMDYKVVVILSWGGIFSSFISFVYSLQRGRWRKLVDFHPQCGGKPLCDRNAIRGFISETGGIAYPEVVQDLEVCPQRFFKGCWHWMAANRSYGFDVLSFDLVDESFSLFGAPPGYTYEYHGPDSEACLKGGGVFVLNESLCAVYLPNPCVEIDVWMMMEYGVEESWTRVYSIQPNFYGEFSRIVGVEREEEENGGIKRMFLEDGEKKQLVSCDENGYVDHDVYGLSSAIWWNTLGISTYVESIEPL